MNFKMKEEYNDLKTYSELNDGTYSCEEHIYKYRFEYKSNWNGRNYIKIDTFYASSRLCFSCGYKNTNVKDLKVRDWICHFCNTKHDRDINAAKNIVAEGLRQVV